MPDRRRHRGRHPSDDELFSPAWQPRMQLAVAELGWLLERGYSEVSALKLVGDRHGLRERQRRAVLRSSAGDTACAGRARRRIDLADLAGRRLAIDGFNCLITVEAGFAGGLVLVGQDGCFRDLASVHGSYRRVEETAAAIAAVGRVLAGADLAQVCWYLDRPVSNSGRLRQLILEQAEPVWDWSVELHDNPDPILAAASDRVAATSDSWILDHCGPWIDLPRAVIEDAVAGAWIVDLGRSA